jgi:hypothetical protein
MIYAPGRHSLKQSFGSYQSWLMLATHAAVALLALPAAARPIQGADSVTLRAEYGAGNSREVQVFYAPRHFWSVGVGHMSLETVSANAHEVSYARVNFLARRWNFEEAQANVFVWGGLGSAYFGPVTIRPDTPDSQPSSGHDHGPLPGEVAVRYRGFREAAWNAGGQIDYETLRFYTSLRTDTHRADTFSHRVDSFQVGFSPYDHEVDSLSAWLIVSARRYSGHSLEGDELALLLRLFRKNAWLEAGATTDGDVRAMAMFSF